MSTMPLTSQSLRNQVSETPFIGKVRPPSGPWNDSNEDGGTTAW